MVSIWFFPYSILIPHRHFMSHCPIFGTLGRLAYIAFTLVPIWVIAGRPSLPALPIWLLGLVVGLMVSDTIHWILDVKPSRKGRKR